MSSLLASFTIGTHRLASPEETLRKITPHLLKIGITRCADVTALDNLSIPVYCAIRPTGSLLQVSSGKGVTHLNAKISALMEAIEIYHAENPQSGCSHRASAKQLRQKGLRILEPELFGGFSGSYMSNDYVIDWVEGEDLFSQAKVWVPASAVYFGFEPSLNNFSTNGLASGNHIIEATLHGIYELIERDAIAKLNVDGYLKIKEKCSVVDLSTIQDADLLEIISKIQAAQSKIILLWVESCIRVHTFWAVMINHDAFGNASTLNLGYGTHANIKIAASRAITEAAQSRAVFIHASREDISYKPVYKGHSVESSAAYKFFKTVHCNANWDSIKARVPFDSIDLNECYHYLLSELERIGFPTILRFDLTNPEFDIPVTKVIIPSFENPLDVF
jgi:ribosomal protein S12 methylthiotransferase accessory factor